MCTVLKNRRKRWSREKGARSENAIKISLSSTAEILLNICSKSYEILKNLPLITDQCFSEKQQEGEMICFEVEVDNTNRLYCTQLIQVLIMIFLLILIVIIIQRVHH